MFIRVRVKPEITKSVKIDGVVYNAKSEPFMVPVHHQAWHDGWLERVDKPEKPAVETSMELPVEKPVKKVSKPTTKKKMTKKRKR